MPAVALPLPRPLAWAVNVSNEPADEPPVLGAAGPEGTRLKGVKKSCGGNGLILIGYVINRRHGSWNIPTRSKGRSRPSIPL